MRAKIFIFLLLLVPFAVTTPAQEFLDRVEDNLGLQSSNGLFRAHLSGLFDLEGYYIDQRPPGLLYEDQSFANPRLSLFLDVNLGPHIYAFLQARLDRGFDPGWKDYEARLDEYLLRWTPFDDSRLNLQFGKFATVVGSWVQRHDSWQNPLITAPLPYENMTVLSDEYVPASPTKLLARKSVPDIKETWVPIIWGPVYATGGSIFGDYGLFDYAFELKNAALSSNPSEWELNNSYWRYPSIGGRVGLNPGPSWKHGVSFSIGPYLAPDASGLPAGKTISDYNQITLDYDVGYAWHRWQLWGEVFLNRFEVPNVGDADALAYYLEAKLKLTSALYAAARWNQEIFGTINNGYGHEISWNRDMFRIDLALGCRLTRHLQGKLQYSYGRRDGELQQGEQLLAAQVTLKF